MTKTCKNVPGSGTSLLLFLTLAFASLVLIPANDEVHTAPDSVRKG